MANLQDNLTRSLKDNNKELDISLLLDDTQFKQYQQEMRKFADEIEKSKLSVAEKELAIAKKATELNRVFLREKVKSLKELHKDDEKGLRDQKDWLSQYVAANKALREEEDKAYKSRLEELKAELNLQTGFTDEAKSRIDRIAKTRIALSVDGVESALKKFREESLNLGLTFDEALQKFNIDLANKQVEVKALAETKGVDSEEYKQASDDLRILATQFVQFTKGRTLYQRTQARKEVQDKRDRRKQEVENILNNAKALGESISKEDREKLKENNKEELKVWIESITGPQGLGKLISDGLKNLANAADKAFSEAENILNTYQAVISTRLEGSGRDYKDITSMLRKNLTLSPIVEQKKVLENVGRMVEQGIAYNLEQRAFLQTVSEEIKSTFNAFDANLLRLIRIQREDSSYARMGLETSLTRLFNEYFLDSSYMQQTYDDVAGAILDATSQLTTAQSAEFEYTVQKWLGSMYSMGVSSSLIQSIASGLNMLGTGNVAGLANSPMQTLFAMAANRTSTDYASLLTGGLTAQNTNELLKAMVEYLAEISSSTKENRVVAGAYGNLFNMTLSDMRAIQNLTSDIDAIYGQSLTYSQMGGVTNQRLTTLGSNYSLGKRVSTLFNNIMFSSAESLVEDPVSYLLYKALNVVGSMGEPTISVAPFGMGMEFKLTDLMKDAMFGISMLANITGAIGQLMSENGNELMNWTTQGEMRGSAYNLSTRQGISQSYTMTNSGSDIETQTLQSGAQKTKETNKTIKGTEEEEEDITISELYYGLFNNVNKEGALSAMNSNMSIIKDLLNSAYFADLGAHRVVITGWNLGADNTNFELPVKFGKDGQAQVSNTASVIVSLLKGADDATLGSILNLLLNALSDDESFNVNLLSADLDFAEWAKGQAGSGQNQKEDMQEVPTRRPPSGNGATRPSNIYSSVNAGKVLAMIQ